MLFIAIDSDPTSIKEITCKCSDRDNCELITKLQKTVIDKSIYNILYINFIYAKTKEYAREKIKEINKQNISKEECNQLEIIEKIINN